MALLPHPSAPASVAVLLAAAGAQGDRALSRAAVLAGAGGTQADRAFICLRVLAGG